MAKSSNNVLAIGVGLNLDPLKNDIHQAANTAKDGMETIGNSISSAGTKADKPLRETKDKLISLSSQLRQARLDAQQLALGGKELGEAFQASVAKAASLKDQIAAVDNEILKNTQTINSQGQPAFQAAKSGYNGMAMSINQLTREMPAFTYSMQTGFMAISNNIPMFVDQINAAKLANKGLAESGQPVQSVMSQIASNLFSWQTLMGVGITVLTVYGAEIVKWVSSLGGANDAVEKINKSMRMQLLLINSNRESMKLWTEIYDKGLTGRTAALRQQEIAHEEAFNKIVARSLEIQKQENETGEKQIIARNENYFALQSLARTNAEKIQAINKDFDEKELKQVQKTALKKRQYQARNIIQSENGRTQFVGFGNAPIEPKLPNLTPPNYVAEQYTKLSKDMLNAKILLVQTNESIWKEIKANTKAAIASTFTGIGTAIGDSLAASLSGEDADMMDAIGVAIVKSLGQMAVQVGSMLIAMSVPMMLAGLPQGFVYAAAGTGLIAVGSMVSGLAGRKSKGGSSQPNTPSIAESTLSKDASMSSNFLPTQGNTIVINGMIKGNDIQLVNGRNDKKFNRNFNFG
jgi:hypothetical protein